MSKDPTISPFTVYNEIIRKQWNGILEWKDDEAEETSYLEFKRKEDFSVHKLSNKDKELLSKAISGFSNSYGGVIVFGIHATKDKTKEGPDKVRSITQISDIEKAQAYLERNIPNLTEPPVPGILVAPIKDPSDSNKGILVIYVPESYLSPHRARGGTEVQDRYYMRSSTETVIVPHAALAAMFGRRPPPRLIPKATLQISLGSIQMRIWIKNQGKGFARNVAAQFSVQRYCNISTLEFENHHFSRGDSWIHLQQDSRNDSSKIIVQANQGIILYPDTECYCGYYHRATQEISKEINELKIAIDISIYSIDSISQSYQLREEYSNFRAILNSTYDVKVMPISKFD